MANNAKVLVLGVDAMDPLVTRRFMRESIMPNMEKLMKMSSCRYDCVAVYKKKKDSEPLYVLRKDVFEENLVDIAIKKDKTYNVTHNMRVLELAEDGTHLKVWISPGRRVVVVALRNKDAVLLGYGGPECGDICFWMAEGYNLDHGDSLSATLGIGETSVFPIFCAAGPHFKKNYRTDRIIRQVDVTPTVAAILGTRMPTQCEGAPVYQILENYSQGCE